MTSASEGITQVTQSNVVDDSVTHVYFFHRCVPVVQEIPAELAPRVSAEPLGLALEPAEVTQVHVTTDRNGPREGNQI